MSEHTISLALFCKVVDNFGDIGICWRLARQLRREHGIDVTLWVDDLGSFARLCPAIDTGAAMQQAEGVTVRHWRGQDERFSVADVADIVIEFFAVDIPPSYIEAMAARARRPLWFNLEGLSAEEWVEGCHALPSMHPRLPLTKHFFFPGFTGKTGGLLRERGLGHARDAFQSDPAAVAAFLAGLGVTPAELAATRVSLFCYPHAPVAELFAAWQAGAQALTCLVPQGVGGEAVDAFLDGAAVRTRGLLTVRRIPFVPQDDYDRLLWACDINLVRGEDSFVRAQWALRPFIWHIYPQDEALHHQKLNAFLRRYGAPGASLAALSLRWNGAPQDGPAGALDWPALWRQFVAEAPALQDHALQWERAVLAHGDLAFNLLKFADSLSQDKDEESRQN
jgi:uncharacterized repeat protein (TIGR03837 family)